MLVRILNGFRRHGLRDGLRRYFYAFRKKLWFAAGSLNDKRRDVDFYTIVEHKGTPEALAGNHDYEATGFLYERHLKKLLRRSDHADDRIIDIGCGKGRALEIFNAFGFSKSDGLEYSPALSEIARENMKKLGLPCEVFTGDAALFGGYDDYNWFYLYNPFSHDIMLRFIEKLKESLRRSPRRITIIYALPTCETDFAKAGFHMDWAGKEKYKIGLITSEGMPEDGAGSKQA